MTLNKLDAIWLSDSADTDCGACGLRYFAECGKCKKITCTWCGFAAQKAGPSSAFHLCEACEKASYAAKETP